MLEVTTEVTVTEVVVWIIVDALAGSLAGLVVTRKKEGFGKYSNLGIGMAGALIGGFLFDVLKIDLGLANISISLQDPVAAFVGSPSVPGHTRLWLHRYSKKKAQATANKGD